MWHQPRPVPLPREGGLWFQVESQDRSRGRRSSPLWGDGQVGRTGPRKALPCPAHQQHDDPRRTPASPPWASSPVWPSQRSPRRRSRPPLRRSILVISELQQALDQLVEDGAPGALLYTYDHGRVTELQSGVADIAAGTPMSPQDHYRIGSLKDLRATAVLDWSPSTAGLGSVTPAVATGSRPGRSPSRARRRRSPTTSCCSAACSSRAVARPSRPPPSPIVWRTASPARMLVTAGPSAGCNPRSGVLGRA